MRRKHARRSWRSARQRSSGNKAAPGRTLAVVRRDFRGPPATFRGGTIRECLSVPGSRFCSGLPEGVPTGLDFGQFARFRLVAFGLFDAGFGVLDLGRSSPLPDGPRGRPVVAIAQDRTATSSGELSACWLEWESARGWRRPGVQRQICPALRPSHGADPAGEIRVCGRRPVWAFDRSRRREFYPPTPGGN